LIINFDAGGDSVGGGNNKRARLQKLVVVGGAPLRLPVFPSCNADGSVAVWQEHGGRRDTWGRDAGAERERGGTNRQYGKTLDTAEKLGKPPPRPLV